MLQNKCITIDETDTEIPDKASNSDNAFKLIKIISKKGAGAFNGFLKALNDHAQYEPGAMAHKELYETLNAGAMLLSKRRRPSGSSYRSQTSVTSFKGRGITESFELPTLESHSEYLEESHSKQLLISKEGDENVVPPIEEHTACNTDVKPDNAVETVPEVS